MENSIHVNCVEKIEEHLYLGDYSAAIDLKILKSLNIKFILSVFNETIENKVDSITYMRVDINNYYLSDLITCFEETNQFIAKAQSFNQNVLVHCHMGHSRSAAVVIAYLMNKYKITYSSSRNILSKSRAIDHNFGFVDQLKLYEEMNFTIDANNRDFRKHLFETSFNSDYKLGNRKNRIKLYFDKRQRCELLSENLNLGHNFLCTSCGFKLFNELHIIESPHEQQTNTKCCQWTCIEPQIWMEQLTKSFDEMTDFVVRCPKCGFHLMKHKKCFMNFFSGCRLHNSIPQCLCFWINNENFKNDTCY